MLLAMRTHPLLSRFGALTLLFTTMCTITALSADYPPTADGAKALLKAFVQPGADQAALTKPLQPTTTDYATVFEEVTAAKVQAIFDPLWQSGSLVIKPNTGQTEVLLESVPSSEVRAWTEAANKILPGGWARMKGEIKEGLTIHRFKFVKPGETSGMSYDGLIHVNGQWRIFAKAWKARE